MREGMFKSTLVLTVVCLIAAALLGLAYSATAGRIEEQKNIALKDSLNHVFQDADDFEAKENYYIAKKDNQIIGYAAIAESRGYSSVLKILIGMDLDNKLTGIRIMEQAETPGLGANSVRPEFYAQFNGLSLNEIALKRDNGKIDAITGATITSSAVINRVREKLEKLIEGSQYTGDINATRVDATTEATKQQNKSEGGNG